MTVRAAALDMPLDGCLQVSYHSTGEPQGILQYHSCHGFLNVPDPVLDHVMAELGLDMDALGKAEDPSDAKVLAIIMAINPTTQQEQVEEMLLHRARTTAPEHDAGLVATCVNDDHMKGVMTESDEKDAKDFVEDQGQKQLKSKGKKKAIASLTARRFVSAKEKGAVVNKRNAARTKVIASGLKELKKFSDARWCVKVKPEDESLLDLLKPPVGRFGTDLANGCYRVYYPGERVRSVSWTIRGVAQAQELALQHLWQMHGNNSLDVCPWPGLERPYC
jgi:hypothetical protein